MPCRACAMGEVMQPLVDFSQDCCELCYQERVDFWQTNFFRGHCHSPTSSFSTLKKKSSIQESFATMVAAAKSNEIKKYERALLRVLQHYRSCTIKRHQQYVIELFTAFIVECKPKNEQMSLLAKNLLQGEISLFIEYESLLLHKAIKNEVSIPCICQLIQWGFDLEERDDDGLTAIQVAIQSDQWEKVKQTES